MGLIIAQILMIVFLPVQFLPLGFVAVKNGSSITSPQPQSRVEGASTENISSANKPQNVGDSISGNIGQQSQSSFLPEKTENFQPIKVFAGSSVVLDVDSGTILHYANGRTHLPIASLTKVMTAVLVMENVKNLDEPIAIDQDSLKTDGTKVGCPTSVLCVDETLHPGETLTVKDLMTAMLVDSANDAAIVLGKYVAGSQQAFADMMNEKAKKLNLSDSHFCNPSGLDIEGCYSSAYDLARIAAYSMRYDMIWKIMNTQEADISSCDGAYTHHLKNTDILLDEIPNCLGGKTGFTYNAGKSLMLGAVDPAGGKHRIIAVVLNDNNRWEDMKNLLNWTFTNYEWK